MDSINISKQLEKSVSPSSVIITNDNNEPAYLPPGTEGMALFMRAGKAEWAQLPGYVDDVIEYPSLATFPSPGENGKLFIALDTGKVYRWSGTAYVEISGAPVIGPAQVAYGDPTTGTVKGNGNLLFFESTASILLGSGQATGARSIAAGTTARATGEGSVAMGTVVQANARSSISLGRGCIVNAPNAAYIGYSGTADATESVGLGSSCWTRGAASIAAGWFCTTKCHGEVSLGAHNIIAIPHPTDLFDPSNVVLNVGVGTPNTSLPTNIGLPGTGAANAVTVWKSGNVQLGKTITQPVDNGQSLQVLGSSLFNGAHFVNKTNNVTVPLDKKTNTFIYEGLGSETLTLPDPTLPVNDGLTFYISNFGEGVLNLSQNIYYDKTTFSNTLSNQYPENALHIMVHNFKWIVRR